MLLISYAYHFVLTEQSKWATMMYMSTTQTTSTIQPLLHAIGLTEKEALLYVTLLELGSTTAGKLALETKLKRGITYAALKKLMINGLVTETIRDKVSVFTPTHPRSLQALLEKRLSEMHTHKVLLEDKLPALATQYKLHVGKPTVSFFQGRDGLTEVFKDIYAPKDEPVYGCVDVAHTIPAIDDYIAGTLIPLRIKNGLEAITVIPDSVEGQELQKKDLKQLRSTSLIPSEGYPLPAEIDVYADKVAMLTFEKGDFTGVIIENKAIADTMRTLLRLVHLHGKKRV